MKLKDIKPLPMDKTEKEFKKKHYETPVKKIPFPDRKIRENVPPVELAWLKVKAYFRNAGKKFETKFDMAISTAIQNWVKYYGWIFALIALLLIAIYLGTK